MSIYILSIILLISPTFHRESERSKNIYYSAKKDSWKVVKQEIKKGFDINYSWYPELKYTFTKINLLDISINNSNLEIFEWLLLNNIVIKRRVVSRLKKDKKYQYLKVLNQEIKKVLIEGACKKNDYEKFKKLVSENFDIDWVYKIYNNYEEIGRTTIEEICGDTKDKDIRDFFEKRGKKLGEKKFEEKNSVDNLKLLLKDVEFIIYKGDVLDRKNYDNKTKLSQSILAAKNGNYDYAIKDIGIEYSSLWNEHILIYYHALMNKHWDIVYYLINLNSLNFSSKWIDYEKKEIRDIFDIIVENKDFKGFTLIVGDHLYDRDYKFSLKHLKKLVKFNCYRMINFWIDKIYGRIEFRIYEEIF